MKQILTLFAAILLLAVGATAQKLSYQAVVRNDANELVAGATVQVTVSILNATGDVQYAESHANVQTNLNGLLSLMIGDGTPTGTATMADVVWTGASVKTIITLPGGVSVTSVTPVNAVPYALYADNVDPSVVEDAVTDYIAAHGAGGEANVQADWNVTDPTSDAYIQNKPVNVSAFNNNAGYITAADIPAIPIVPTNVSAFNNDAGYISAEQCGGVDICALAALVSELQNQVATLQSTIDSLIASDTTDGEITPDDTTQTPIDTSTTYGIPCPNTPTVTDHEGNVYNTVQIGTQCWTRENLRTTTSPSTGTYLIPPANTTYTYTGKQARWFNNDSITYAPKNYGLLYNYNAAIDTYNLEFGETSVVTAGDYERGFDFVGHRRGICPLGWHLPSDEEWTTLAYYVSSQDSCVSEFATYNNRTWIAKALASTTDWNNSINTAAVGNNQQTNNITGFSALPSGGYGFLGYGVCGFMRNVGDYANFWSTNYLYPRIFINGNQFVARGEGYGTLSCFSVRCLRDEDSGSSPTLVVDEKPCPNTPTVTDVDGNVYNAVMIGEQCWMKENLRTTHYANGDTILFGNARKYPNNDQSNVAEYGYLYQWYATMHLDNSYQGQTLDIQGICPTGWHVPSYTEWGALADYAGQNYYGLIASTGFSTQLAGRYWDGYHNFGERNYFWTRDYVVNQAVHYRFMDDAMNLSSNGETENAYAFFSVRCLRD